jgi:hypothetical protein
MEEVLQVSTHGANILVWGAQIPDARSSCPVNFGMWRLIFVDPQYGTWFMPSFWHLEFCGDSRIFVKFVHR